MQSETDITLNILKELLEQLGIDLQYAVMEGEGGLAKYNGKTSIILNRNIGKLDQISRISGILRTMDLSNVFLKPKIRELIQGEAQ